MLRKSRVFLKTSVEGCFILLSESGVYPGNATREARIRQLTPDTLVKSGTHRERTLDIGLACFSGTCPLKYNTHKPINQINNCNLFTAPKKSMRDYT